jgi:twinkle protein
MIKLNEFGIYPNGTSGDVRSECPQCSKEHPNGQKLTLSVNIEKQVWKCFRCGWSGGIPKIKYEKLEVSQKNATKTIYDFFEARGISPKIVQEFGIKQEIKTIEGKPKKVIAFNYFIGNDIVNVKYRTSDKNFLQHKGGKRTLYNFNGIFKDYIIICEGEIDVLSFAESGLNAVSVPSANTNIDFLNEIKYLLKDKKIYLALDKDEAGYKTEIEIVKLLGLDNLYLIEFFDCKDANQFLIEYGKEELKMRFELAEPYPDEEISKASDYIDEVKDLLLNGYANGFKTGLYEIDNSSTWYKGRVAVITGVPGSGKSTFCDELILRLSLKNNLKTLIFSSENGERKIHLERFITQYYDKENNEITEKEIETFLEIADKHFNFLEIDNPSIEYIFEKFEQQIKHKKFDILVIDPYNTLEHKRPRDLSLTEYVGEFLNKCLLFARKYDILLFIIAHPKKMQKKGEFISEPSLYDISDSANWYNKCEYGVVVHRFGDGKSKIQFAKFKNKYMGRAGFKMIDFNPKTETFHTNIHDIGIKYL